MRREKKHLLSKMKHKLKSKLHFKWYHKTLLSVGLVLAILITAVAVWALIGQTTKTDKVKEVESSIPDRDYVSNELLVKLDKDTGQQEADDFADRNGLELVKYNKDTGVAKFKTESDTELVNVIRDNEKDYEVEPNWIYKTLGIEDNEKFVNQWGYRAMDVKYAYEVTKGSGVKVAVIDTGIDIDHPDLIDRVSPESYNTCTGSNILDDVDDKAGHGTHVSGIIVASDNTIGTIGVAPEAELVAIKAQCPNDSSGNFAGDELLDALHYVVGRGIKVVNMSLGGSNRSSLMASAIKEAIDSGITIVAAAGNSKSSNLSYPASYDGVFSVGALDSGLSYDSSYSNFGNRIDFTAPGTGVYSTYPGGKYTYLDGTSMASPQVAGVATIVLAQNPGLNSEQVKDIIKNSVIDRGDPGKDQLYGWGSVNAGNIFSQNTKIVTVDYRHENRKLSFKTVLGEKIDRPTNFDRPNYGNAEGWYKDPKFKEPWDFNNDIVQEDTTIYAKYRGEVYIEYIDEFSHYSQDGINYIFGIDPKNITYEAVMAKIGRSWKNKSRIYERYGPTVTSIGAEIADPKAKIGSGNILKTIQDDGSEKIEVIIIVGDIIGVDPGINKTDYDYLRSIVLGSIIASAAPTTIDLKTADINADGTLDDLDVLAMKAFIDKTGSIDQTTFRSITDTSYKYVPALIGDVYEDGRISIADVSAIYQYLEGIRGLSQRQLMVADVNKDGKVTGHDGKIIQRYLAGTYSKLPVSVPELYGDVNWDGKVDYADVYRLQNSYLPFHDESPDDYPWYLWYIADVNLDGEITIVDANIIAAYIGYLEGYRESPSSLPFVQ